jgi:glycosyltransferase involved in cell wall biosynthesis
MSMGRPIITTDAPGCRETVQEGINGFLVPVKDAVALEKAMEKFILKPELIREFGMESRKIAEEKYDVRKVNKVIIEAMGLK